MVSKKNLVIAVLLTFCLTAVLFWALPTLSLAPYDPQYDVNHDGKIDGRDITLVAKAFGTNGDPTVPVNVTNWPISIFGLGTPPAAAGFPSNLNLVGTYATTGVGHILLDSDTPYPNPESPPVSTQGGRYDFDGGGPWSLSSSFTSIYTQTFTYQKVSTSSYSILGELQASMTMKLTTSGPASLSLVTSVDLYAVSTSGMLTLLSPMGTAGIGWGTTTFTNTLVCVSVSSEVLTPIIVGSLERLAVTVTVSASSAPSTTLTSFEFMYTMGTDDFLVTIPIV